MDIENSKHQARERNRKTIAAWVARWQRMSALNLQHYLADQASKAKGASDG